MAYAPGGSILSQRQFHVFRHERCFISLSHRIIPCPNLEKKSLKKNSDAQKTRAKDSLSRLEFPRYNFQHTHEVQRNITHKKDHGTSSKPPRYTMLQLKRLKFFKHKCCSNFRSTLSQSKLLQGVTQTAKLEPHPKKCDKDIWEGGGGVIGV